MTAVPGPTGQIQLLQQNVLHSHASGPVRSHGLYIYYVLGRKKSEIAVLFGKSQTTIATWITQFETGGGLCRQERMKVYKKHGPDRRLWIVRLYRSNPVLFLDEAKRLYGIQFPGSTASTSSISLILKEAGLSYKTLERRAIQISTQEVLRFGTELSEFPWLLSSIVCLDQVGIDNKGMLRKNGWGVKGQGLYFRGEFCRQPRVSCLTFVNINGIVENFITEGTFNRTKLKECFRTMALGGKVHHFPGPNSLWILDGASIHCDANIVYYLRSLGIKIIYLPAYCPFFNPIELVFGLLKRALRRSYVENSKKDLKIVVAEGMMEFDGRDLKDIFRKCGYSETGFDPGVAFNVPLSE